ncbi:MAG TPA: NusG domain II-containing protein [Lachnospiraceae bacterium]|nr:NusG domain II-containing protein [uncultured Lachnoclostridium sp.]HAU85170.1 NusG domain II-containing protein [Lachnospiraceae bacterium]
MKKGDIILICILVLIGGGIVLSHNVNKKAGNQVVITVDGDEYRILDLEKDQKIKIVCKDGHYNVLTIENGKADMTESDCKNQVCVKTVPISHIGDSISCLPHKVMVKIVAKSNMSAEDKNEKQ